MKTPFAYVVLVEYGRYVYAVSAHSDIDDAEDALRGYAATFLANGDEFPDHEIVEAFADDGGRVSVFACAMRDKIQTSGEVEPFTRRQVVA
jgi:hypothetical protein